MTETLMEKMISNSSLKMVAPIAESKVFGDKMTIKTPVPALNIAMSGKVDGGFSAGLTILAAPSRHFKSNIMLVMGAAFQRKFKDGIILFYDSEYGSPPDYLESAGIDVKRVVHLPITNIEEFKFDITKKLENITRKQNVMIMVDSIGNLASLKEVEDAKDEKSVADMTRAKALKSLFRMITPHLTMKDIPMVAINHVYAEIGMFPKDIMGGGTGPMLAADTVLFIGKRQEKEGTEIAGYTFTMITEKSRFVREKSKIPLLVKFDNGIDMYSGLVELSLESGHLTKPSNGWYLPRGSETKMRLKDVQCLQVFKPILSDPEFKEFVAKKYMLAGDEKMLVSEEELI